MKLKSYFSGTVEAAMELARKELGDEALLINARLAPPETRAFGAFEVVFGIPPANPPSTIPSTPGAGGLSADPVSAHRASTRDASTRDASMGDAAVQDLRNDVAELKCGIERLADLLQGQPLLAVNPPPGQQAAGSHLWDAELDSELAQKLAQGAAFEDLFEVDATLGRPGASRTVVALVGPPGAGKTTALIKLAARYGLAARRPAHILSTDVYRIAAAGQLQSLAALLGIGCSIAETPAALAQALAEHRSQDLLFIDTPGLGPADMEDCADLARLIGSHPEMDVHLVLPSTMKPTDLRQVIDRYEPFHAGKLLFTRIDESSRFGMLINESVRCELPVSFLSTGQQIPDDLEPATKARLAALVRGKTPVQTKRAGAAA
jgi:flagellar biosynthesis protein FlhF